MNYYNEWDRKAAAWLRELIKEGVIPEGHVDERSIVEVKASDLAGYAQCHFFAGIGGWSEALRLAGFPATRSVWTASLPCQPFSSASKQLGVEDERHLWPIFFGLVKKCRPDLIFGEQVARAIGFNWLDGIRADLETEDYAIGAAVLGAHSVRAPHKRMRLNWMAHAQGAGLKNDLEPRQEMVLSGTDANGSSGDALGVTKCAGLEGFSGNGDDGNESRRERKDKIGSTSEAGDASALAIPNELDGNRTRFSAGDDGGKRSEPEIVPRFWDSSQWLVCLDGKARRIEPSIQPLAHGVPGRVGLLRGAGNAIVPQASAEFVKAFLEIEKEN